MKPFPRKVTLANGEIRWYAYVRINGKQKSFGGWPTREMALKQANLQLKRLASGKMEDISFGEYAELWLEDSDGRVKPRTHDDYVQINKNHLGDLHEIKLSMLMPRDIKNLVNRKQKPYKVKQGDKEKTVTLSPRTVNKIITLIKAILNGAVKDEYLEVSPARFIEKLKEEKQEMDFLVPDEITKFLDAASDRYYPLFATAILTGMREGELFALRWGDIDFKKRAIIVQRSYHPKHGFSSTKTKAGRRAVEMTDELIRLLKSMKDGHKPGDLVFTNENGKPIHYANMNEREFHPALERAKLRRIRFHDLRHTYATLRLSLGENLKYIQQQMGHASITTTIDLYGHLLPSVSEGAGKRLDSLLFGNNVIQIRKPREDGRATSV